MVGWSGLRTVVVPVALALAASAGCTRQGNCPAKGEITPGAACDDEQLQCAYDLLTPSQPCDGTSTTIPTSCICTDGTWQCPAPFDCSGAGGGGTGGGAHGGADGGA